jgi:hypothetical protein
MKRAPFLGAHAWLAALSVVCAGASARADNDKAMAEALFRDGKALLAAGKVPEACGKLAESHRIDPKIGTLLNVAACHQQEGKSASAWAEFTEAATQAGRANQADRVRFARQHADEVEKALSRLTLEAKAAQGVEVTLDGRTIGAAALGSAIPVDPGPHTIQATAAGKKPWSGNVVAEKGPASQTVTIPPLADEAPAATAPAPAPTAQAQPERPPPEPSGPSAQRLTGFVVGGVGLVVLGVGAYFGVRTLDKKAEGDKLCSGAACSQAGLDAENDAHTAATISTIGVGLGAAALVTGLVLVLTAPSSRKTTQGLRLSPDVALGRGGMVLGGRW